MKERAICQRIHPLPVQNHADQSSLYDNDKAYDRYKLRPRVLRDVHDVDMTSKIFGVKVSYTVISSFSSKGRYKLMISGDSTHRLRPSSSTQTRPPGRRDRHVARCRAKRHPDVFVDVLDDESGRCHR